MVDKEWFTEKEKKTKIFFKEILKKVRQKKKKKQMFWKKIWVHIEFFPFYFDLHKFYLTFHKCGIPFRNFV